MESTVDPLTKEPEYEAYRNIWPTEQAAKSELIRKYNEEAASGKSPEAIQSDLKKYMADMIQTDQSSARYKDESDDDEAIIPMNNDEEDWTPTTKESNGPLIKTRDILSTHKVPGTTLTYFDYLNDKMQDAELVDKEIRDALIASKNDVNKAISMIKEKVANMPS